MVLLSALWIRTVWGTLFISQKVATRSEVSSPALHLLGEPANHDPIVATDKVRSVPGERHRDDVAVLELRLRDPMVFPSLDAADAIPDDEAVEAGEHELNHRSMGSRRLAVSKMPMYLFPSQRVSKTINVQGFIPVSPAWLSISAVK